MKRTLLAVIAVLALGACGQTDPPDNATLQQKLSQSDAYFQVERPDGTMMWCNQYGDDTEGTQESKSWFSYDCDWAGQYGTQGER